MANPLAALRELRARLRRPAPRSAVVPAPAARRESWVPDVATTNLTDQEATKNSAVAICLGWISDNILGPHLIVERPSETGQPARIWDHPLLDLLRRPNHAYDWATLLGATAWDYAAFGNAYWLKRRDPLGLPEALWYLPPHTVRPVGDAGEMQSWEYTHRRGRLLLRPEDVIHFRSGLDPSDIRLGRSRLASVLLEVATDTEASRFMNGLLLSSGCPGVVISPDPKTDVDAGAIAAVLAAFRAARGRRAGSPIVLEAPVTVTQYSLSPEQLALEKLRWTPEARICGALRIPALVVGLNVGDLTRTYANYRQARRAAYEDCILPLADRLAHTLAWSLLPEWGSEDLHLRWDYSSVAAMREDLADQYKRLSLAVSRGWMTPNEARADVGYSAHASAAADELAPQNTADLGGVPNPDSGQPT